MVTRATPGPRALEDEELARRAIAGDGTAFAELYDRHERRVYGFCVRMLGSTHDAADATQETFVRVLKRLPSLEGRELNFVAYVLRSARHACYDAIESRRRVEPVADHDEQPAFALDEDPERAALLGATREQVLRANDALPPRQREVLALREVEELSYEQIGELMKLNPNAVAQLISRARLKLRDNLCGTALESIAPGSPDCDRALPMLAARKDGERSLLRDWLDEHLAACETCRLRREAMEEAGSSYRAIGLIVPLVWLRQATIARAADYVGADWSRAASSPRNGEPPEPPPSGGPPHGLGRRRRRRRELMLAGVVCILVVLLLVGSLGQGSQTPGFVPAAAVARTHPRHPRRHRSRAAHRRTLRPHVQTAATTTTSASLASTHGYIPPPATQHRHHTSGRTETTTVTTAATTTVSTTVTTTTTSSSTTTTPPTTTSSSSSTTTNPFNGQPGTVP